MLPEAALPLASAIPSGKFNFTRTDSEGRRIEVQLQNKVFYLKATGHKKPYVAEGDERSHPRSRTEHGR